jgi:wyosine [tRNA(Phe)-imidazoG37] synthetase (radical SAM superfamily)
MHDQIGLLQIAGESFLRFKYSTMIAFGPIPSRRLGQSLGVNHIPPKNCTYNCVYCQVGSTTHLGIKRRAFYTPEEVFLAVQKRVREVQAAGGQIDYLTLVPDGEPTLDIHLGEIIKLLRTLNIKIAIITNATLLWMEDVRNEIKNLDRVSIKIDSVIEDQWKKVDRPNPLLSLPKILDGIIAFSKIFTGRMSTETMLVRGVNDSEMSLRATAKFLAKLNAETSYIITPTRPPTEPWVEMPKESTLTQAYQIFTENGLKTELLAGFSTEDFSASGDVVQELLNITAVHPLRESEVFEFFDKGGVSHNKLKDLIHDEKLTRIVHDGKPFYLRKLPTNAHSS